MRLIAVVVCLVLAACAGKKTVEIEPAPQKIQEQVAPQKPAPVPQEPAVISFGTIEGSGMRELKWLDAPGPWTIQWEFSGEFIGIIVYTDDGNMYDVVANHKGSGQGQTTEPKGGRYRLKVESVGDWRITLSDAR